MLDISNEEENVEPTTDGPKIPRSKTVSSIKDAGKNEDSAWGSFNGSFFEQSATTTIPITNPPPKKIDTSTGAYQSFLKFNIDLYVSF